MRQKDRTKAQQIYRKFNLQSRIFSVFLCVVGIVILILCLISQRYTDVSLAPFLIALGGLVLWFVAFCMIAAKLGSKRIKLYEDAYGKDLETACTGLFGEIWEEFEWNRFEGLTDGKVVFAETHNNTIELEIIRHKHEFNIAIDNDAVYMVMDDETDHPLEREIPLSKITDIGQFFSVIREFVESV